MSANKQQSSKIGISMKQRVREAIWKVHLERQVDRKVKCDELLSKKLQVHYRDNYINRDNIGNPTYIYIRGKAALEVLYRNENEKIKEYMKELNLPGAQITFPNGESPSIEWLCWYDGFIFPDGDNETLSEDPYENRNFELDDDTKVLISREISQAVNQRGPSVSMKEAVYKQLKNTYKETYKERHINLELMPFLTIVDVCVMDVTNRNRGFIMHTDVNTMKKYLNELLIPGALVNFIEGKLSTIAWLSCKKSKLEMEIEMFEEIPSETLNLQLDDNTKAVVREIVIAIHKNKDLHTTNEYKTAIMEKLKDFWPNTHKDKFQKGHMPDITIEEECVVDIKSRNRSIVTTHDRNNMKDSMIDLNMPAVQVNFIDDNSAVILWFSCKNKNMYIELEIQGENTKGTTLADFMSN